jgi:hypothetical protein
MSSQVLRGIAAIALYAILGECFECTTPFQCDPVLLANLSKFPAARWYTLSNGSASYALTWLKSVAPCCLHCIWSLGYPLVDPIVVATDRTISNRAQSLDCARFEVSEPFLHDRLPA